MNARFKYFADIDGQTIELVNVGHKGGPANKASSFHGTNPAQPLVFVPGEGWTGRVTATRIVEMKKSPSRHECDARCLNATGRVMKCECACGGKNHGRGSFVCAEAA